MTSLEQPEDPGHRVLLAQAGPPEHARHQPRDIVCRRLREEPYVLAVPRPDLEPEVRVNYAVLKMDRELQDLRRRLGAIPRGRGRRIPVALRERVVAWMAVRRGHGDWWCELARELGVTASTLKRWTPPRAEGTRPLRPVQVIEEPPSRTVTIVSPSGLRIEGVTIADAITILRGLA